MGSAEAHWIFDYVASILQSPRWDAEVMSFVDEHCIVFDNGEENKFVHTELHNEFKELIERVLTELFAEVGIAEEEFYEACKLHRFSHQVNKSIYDQIIAVDDFLIFKEIMVSRNIELEMEAVQALKSGHIPINKKAACDNETFSPIATKENPYEGNMTFCDWEAMVDIGETQPEKHSDFEIDEELLDSSESDEMKKSPTQVYHSKDKSSCVKNESKLKLVPVQQEYDEKNELNKNDVSSHTEKKETHPRDKFSYYEHISECEATLHYPKEEIENFGKDFRKDGNEVSNEENVQELTTTFQQLSTPLSNSSKTQNHNRKKEHDTGIDQNGNTISSSPKPLPLTTEEKDSLESQNRTHDLKEEFILRNSDMRNNETLRRNHEILQEHYKKQKMQEQKDHFTEEEKKRREEHLRKQRDRIIAKKKAKREKMSMQFEQNKDQFSLKINNVNRKKYEVNETDSKKQSMGVLLAAQLRQKIL